MFVVFQYWLSLFGFGRWRPFVVCLLVHALCCVLCLLSNVCNVLSIACCVSFAVCGVLSLVVA